MSKTKFYFLIVISLWSLKTSGQGAMIVNDPVNTSINSAIQVLSEGSQALQRFTADLKVLEMATSGLEQIQSIQEIAKLVDDLACLSTEFHALFNMQQNYNCVKFLNFRIVNINLKYSTDLLSSVILTKNLFTMSSDARLTNLNRIKETLEKTIKEMQSLCTSLKTNIILKAYKDNLMKNYRADAKNFHKFNRYNHIR